jgi:phage tail-like protein
MPFTQRVDPLRNFRFRVRIDLAEIAGLPDMGFASVSGLSVQNEMIAYREGGWNTSPHKMPGQSDFAPISVSKGQAPNQPQLWELQKYIHFYQFGQGQLVDPRAFRFNMAITVFDHPVTRGYTENTNPGIARLVIDVYNAWIGAFALNELDATSNALLISQATFHHEGFNLRFP